MSNITNEDNYNNKLTIEMISEYIKKNICNFTNNDDEIIIVNNKKQNNIVKSEKIKKSFIESLNDININNDIEIDINFFHNVHFVEHLSNFCILKTHNDDNKIYSFYISILSAFDNTFLLKSDEEKQKYIEYLIVHLKSDISQDGFRQHKYSSLKWTKKQILDLIKKNEFTDKLIRVVSDVLHINIFYIDNDDGNKIKYVGDDFIVFKNILLLLKTNNVFYLIYNKNENKKIFDFKSNDFIKSILLNPDYLTLIFCDKFSCVGRNFNMTLNKSFGKENETIVKLNIQTEHDGKDDNSSPELLTMNGFEDDADLSITNNNTKIKKNNEHKIEYTDEINESLSLIELQKKAKEINIDIFIYTNDSRKLKNKKELCIDILNKS